MCGRFTLTTNDYESVARALGATFDPDDGATYRPRYNVAPGDAHWIAIEHAGGRRLRPATWGLPRSDDPRGLHINARSETVHTRPAFRDAFAHTRCVVPADGFFEWTGPADRRLPIWYHSPADLLAFAGLYVEQVHPATGEVLTHFSILTCAANELVAAAHDRMPVILEPDAVDPWLGIQPEALPSLRERLQPAAADRLIATEVSARVNKVAHDDPACITPTSHPRQQTLF